MISVVVLTKNEERNIEKCLKSIIWCDEIIIIDDFSKDNTVKIAKKHRAKVYKRHLNNNFASQRNFGLLKAKKEWVLFIDADEVISKKLKLEILAITNDQALINNTFTGFYLRRKDYFLGKEIKHGEGGSVKLLRLARRTTGATWKRNVHEYWSIKNKIGELKNPILHYPHLTLFEFIEDINKYSTIHAEELRREKKKGIFFKIILWPVGKFVYNFIFKFGFLDGTKGFIFSVIMSFHSFLAWTKLWIS